MACFVAYFLILFLHSLENVDFIKIVVFQRENNVFHSSEGSKITDVSRFLFEAFLGKDYEIDVSLISVAIWAHFVDLLASLFYTFQASFFNEIVNANFDRYLTKMCSRE